MKISKEEAIKSYQKVKHELFNVKGLNVDESGILDLWDYINQEPTLDKDIEEALENINNQEIHVHQYVRSGAIFRFKLEDSHKESFNTIKQTLQGYQQRIKELEEERSAIKEIAKKLDNTLTSYILDNVMLENQQLVLSKNNTLTLQRKIKQIKEVLKDD
jgi:hypothetical protein